MWIANLVKTEVIKDYLNATVNFSDGTPSHEYQPDFTVTSLNELKNKCRNTIEQLTALYALENTLVKGPIDYANTTTQKEIDERHYRDLLFKWREVQQDIANSLIKADDASVVQLQADLKAAYKPEYSGL